MSTTTSSNDSTTTSRRRGRPKTVDRDRIVQAAMKLWWEEGVTGSSLNTLCRRIGVSKPSLYREFGGLDGLMEAVLELYRQVSVVPLITLFSKDYPLSKTLETAIQAMTTDRGVPVGCLLSLMRQPNSGLGPLADARLAELLEERRVAFAAWYQRAIDAGEANPGLAPEVAARYVDAQFNLLLLQMASGEPPDQIRTEARLAFQALKKPPEA